MFFVPQSTLHGEGKTGDCLRACVASIIELPIENVPHFALHQNWLRLLQSWAFDTHNVHVVYLSLLPKSTPYTDEFTLWIASGISRRGTRHAVVYKGNRMIWDPHPDKTGLVEVDHAILFVKHFTL